MWSVPTVEYYAALKKEILSHITTGMNLKDVISKIIQSQKDTVEWDYLRKGKIT